VALVAALVGLIVIVVEVPTSADKVLYVSLAEKELYIVKVNVLFSKPPT